MQKLILFLRYLHHLGILNGFLAYMKNYFLPGSNSKIKITNLPYPIYLRKRTSDIEVFNQVIIGKEYDYSLPFTPSFIIDCGANIGMASLFFKSKFPGVTIVAIEPEDSNYNMLVKNTRLYKNINCIQAGIWNKETFLKVEPFRNFGNWGFVCSETTSDYPNCIKALSIPKIMQQYGCSEIDILKIDIEGGEIELFNSGFEDWLPKTKIIMIELHDAYRLGCSKSFFSAIVKYNFSVFHKGENIICIRN